MKRTILFSACALLGALAVSGGTVFAQGATPGFPPQTDLYNDAVMLARALPFIAALGIGFGIWMGRTTMRERKSAPNSPSVIRHDWGAVTAHWANGIGFMIGMVTGGIVLRWLQRPDDMRTIFLIHYVGSSLVIFAIAAHLTQNAVTGGMGLIPRSFRDVLEGLGDLVEYAGVYGPSGAVFHLPLPKGFRRPIGELFASFGMAPSKRLGKYLPAEKVFSYLPWAIIVGVMTITGLIKVMRYMYPISPDLVAQASSLHDFFTIVAIIMLGIHLAALFLVPRHWPLILSMFTTHISRKYVEQWHPQWFKDLQAAEQPSPAPAASAEAKPAAASKAKA